MRNDLMRATIALGILLGTIGAGLSRSGPAAPAGDSLVSEGSPAVSDTAGAGLMEWEWDSWTVPWVQVYGGSRALAPSSHATLMVLGCRASALERDRRVRHLSAEECEHRMAAIRADQDTALVFRVDLRVLDLPGAKDLIALSQNLAITLEDDRGRRWPAKEIRRGPVLGVLSGQKVRRFYLYHPPWLRGSEHVTTDRFTLTGGRSLTLAEHWLRFARRDPLTGELVLDSSTRWLRLRLVQGRNAWVSTWSFRPEEGPVR